MSNGDYVLTKREVSFWQLSVSATTPFCERWAAAGALCVVRDNAFTGGVTLALADDPSWVSPVVYDDEVRMASPLEVLAGTAE